MGLYWWILSLGSFKAKNPRGHRPQGFWPWKLPRDNIHQDTPRLFHILPFFCNPALVSGILLQSILPIGSIVAFTILTVLIPVTRAQLYRWHIWHSCYSASVTHEKTQNTSSAWSDWLRHWYGRGICLHITESVDERVERAVLPWGRLSLYVAISL